MLEAGCEYAKDLYEVGAISDEEFKALQSMCPPKLNLVTKKRSQSIEC